MASTYKTLSQTKPSAATLIDAYTNPVLKQTVISTITVCNQSATPTAYRISVAVAALADTAKQYLFYDTPIAGNETQTLTLGLTMQATDVLRVYNTLATVSFCLFGVQLDT